MDSNNYADLKLRLIEKTYELYLKRMDLWEDQFYKIKYGCITIVTALLGFKYTTAPTQISLNYLALAATLGLWVFEASLRTTFFRYVAKLDVLTEALNSQLFMEEILRVQKLDALRVLDFDIRMKTLREPIFEFVKIVHSEKSAREQNQIAEKILSEKEKLSSFWSSFKLKNLLIFYSALILLQIFALILI